ncbi:DUF3080 family protein [Pseudidiomarina sp.]|uniref:DUF3080 family protein n=1 Tax=Pseudidiomarina sp. TaxID=2081707 RepID=UPI003A987BD0
MNTIVRSLRGLGYASVAFVLMACSDVPTALAPLHDYQTRIANTLARETIEYQSVSVPQLPDVRELRVEVPRVSVSLLDSWRLDQCAAGQLIAQRNSALGKLEGGLTRYFFDRRLTQAIASCIEDLELSGEAALASRLQKAYTEKLATLPASKQLAIATDDALRHTLRVAATSHKTADDDAFAAALAAFDPLLAVLTASATDATAIDEQQLEQALEHLHQTDYLPKLWRTLHELDTYLIQLEPLLNDLPTAAGCTSAGRPERAEVLHTVFLKFFIQRVQPQLAGFTRQGYEVNERLQQLTKVTEQAALQDYLQQLQTLTQRLNQRSRAHVQPWQDFFTACGFKPG